MLISYLIFIQLLAAAIEPPEEPRNKIDNHRHNEIHGDPDVVETDFCIRAKEEVYE